MRRVLSRMNSNPLAQHPFALSLSKCPLILSLSKGLSLSKCLPADRNARTPFALRYRSAAHEPKPVRTELVEVPA
jgi:hypothetical protein